jgi:glyoxylase-like metal-dependent hydrolase (beta-lactamase superfamily II)
MSLTEIASGIHHTNLGAGVFIINRDDVTIVDTGVPGKVDQILDAVREIGRDPSDVKQILVTHYHQDHIGNLGPLAQATGAEVYAPAKEASLIRTGGTAPPVEKRGILGAILSRMVTFTEQPPCPCHYEVSGGDELDIAGGVRVVDASGHSVGHVAYLFVEAGAIFVGDAAANLVRLDVMPINEDFPGAEKSFRAMAELDFDIAGLGHGRQLTRDAAAKFRKAARRFG